MHASGRLTMKLVPLLIASHVLPALAQQQPATPAAPQETAPAPAQAASAAQGQPETKPAGTAASAPAATPAVAPAPGDAKLERVIILGNAVGERQTRANVKITAADLDYYPPGVSADKVLERVSGIQAGSSNAFGGDGFESTINMRGFGKDSIGFSIDGIPNGRTTLGGGSVPQRYFDSSNLNGVDVSQSAGNIGSPSHQALVGHVNYLTQDPEAKAGVRGEGALGSRDYIRAYARLDTGEIVPGVTSYLSVSKENWQVSYVSNPAGQNSREHVDFKAVAKLPQGAVLKLRTGYNDRQEESGTNIVTLAQFNANPKADGYTDTWATTGTAAAISANNRAYRGLKGNPRTDQLTSVDLNVPFADMFNANAKAYYHTQEGIGKDTGRGTAVPGLDGNANSVYFRANNYQMSRRGALGELTGRHGEWLDWKVGAWGERYTRSQIRRWHPVALSGPVYGDPVTTSEDKHWVNTMAMVYAGNTSKLVDGRLKVEYGLSYMDNQVDYRAPIQDSAALPSARLNYVNEASVNSGVLPKIGAVFALNPSTELFGGYAKNAAAVTDATLEANANTSLATARTIRDMDTANAFDLGVRHKGQNFVIGAQAFFVRSTETVAADIPNSLQSQNVDQGRRIHGIELTYNGRLGSDWRLYGAYTLQKHRYELNNVDGNGSPQVGYIRNGQPLVGIADQNAFVEATWRPTDSFKLAANGRFISSRAGYYANLRASTAAGTTTDQRLPGYALFGLNGSFTFPQGNGSIGLNIENVTNKAYISGIAPELMTQASSVGRYFIGSPRTFILWVKVEI